MEFRILEDVFAKLPPIDRDGTVYPIQFQYGSHADLMRYLSINRKVAGSVKYPLLWLETPITFDGYNLKYGGRSEADIVLHIATLSNANMSNMERVRTTFANTLEPLTEEVIEILRSEPSTGIADEDSISLAKTFKFDTDEENAASDIWDAISLRCRIQINYNC